MILFTRTLDDVSRARLREANIDFNETDFLKQIPILTEGVYNFIQNDLSEHLVFTSQNAIKIFLQIIDNQGFKLNKNTKLYSLSGTTKTLLEQLGYPPQLTADSGSALAKAMLENGIKDDVTFICGNLRMPYLPDILIKNNVKVKELIIYETQMQSVMIPPLGAEGKIVFFSPSGVDAFLIKNTLSETATIYAMGKTTAGHIAEKTGIHQVIFPEKPVLSNLMDLIIATK
jgi:uroporphyrinogen-III synthase